MKEYEHKISGIFADSGSAMSAMETVNQQIPVDIKTFLVKPDDAQLDRKLEPEVEGVKDELVSETLTGAGAGAVLGGAAVGLLGASGVALVVASPAIAVLWGLGYGSMLGGIAGAAKSLRLTDGDHASMVKDALANNCHVVVVHAKDATQAERVESVLNAIAQDTHSS